MKKFLSLLIILSTIFFSNVRLTAMDMKAVHHLFSQDDLDVSQKEIQKSIIAYLEKEQEESLSQEEKDAMQTVIEWFKKSGGECAGYSTLWAYGRKLADEEQLNNNQRDDIAFFKETIKKLASWDKKSTFNQKDKNDIERFISNVRFYQFGFNDRIKIMDVSHLDESQLDLSNTLLEIKNNHYNLPILNFKWVVTLPKKVLIDRLKKILKPGAMFFFGVSSLNGHGQHMMSAYQSIKDGKFYFYDPNSKDGEMEINTIDELVELYWNQSSDKEFNDKIFTGFDFAINSMRKITIIIYDFINKNKEYPDQKSLGLTAEECIEFLKNDGALVRIQASKRPQLYIVLKTMNSEEANKILNKNIKILDEECDEECEKEILSLIKSQYPEINILEKNKDNISLKELNDILKNLDNNFEKNLEDTLKALKESKIKPYDQNSYKPYEPTIIRTRILLESIIYQSIRKNKLKNVLKILEILKNAHIALTLGQIEKIDENYNIKLKDFIDSLNN